MKTILITGGTGFIGSHAAVVMLKEGYDIVVVDNLCNSSAGVIDKIREISVKDADPDKTAAGIEFYKEDATDEEAMDRIFQAHNFHGIMHFAGLKAVGESAEKPLEYYYNNTVSTMVLAKLALKYGVKNFIFSSSATVYGDNEVPFKEEMTLRPATNPYGETKAVSEKILMDAAAANPDFCVGILRYFNPVGAHESGMIGENPAGIPNNLMPYIVQVAAGKLDKLRVFGNDYQTPDGTGVRDYIHVMDLAEGHAAAYRHLKPGAEVYNLGTGKGTSVLQLVKAFEEVNNLSVPFEITERRAGDIAESYAGVDKAKAELGWQSKRDIMQMCRDAWNFEQNRYKNRK